MLEEQERPAQGAAAMADETSPRFVLAFCRAAIVDAITLEDGLDAETGRRVLTMIDRSLAQGAAAEPTREEAGTCGAPSAEADALTNAIIDGEHPYGPEDTEWYEATIAALRQSLASAEAREKQIRELAEKVAEGAGCGDNSCLFTKPRGMGTNGGCRCSQKPVVFQRLAMLWRLVVSPSPSEPAR